jgi:DNA-binding transcriptional regulator YiaG
MSKKKYNLEKIRQLTSFDDVLAESLKDPEYKKAFNVALKRLELAHEIMQNREKAKMTQSEFAKELKTSQSFVARMESGTQNITIDVLFRVVDLLSKKMHKQVKFSIKGSEI